MRAFLIVLIALILPIFTSPLRAQQPASPGLGNVHADRARIDGAEKCANIISPLNARGSPEIYRCFAGRHRTIQYSIRRDPRTPEQTQSVRLTWQRWHGRRSTGVSPPVASDRDLAILLLRRLTASFIGADETDGLERSQKYFLSDRDRTLRVGGLSFRYRFRRGTPFHQHILEIRRPPPAPDRRDKIREAAAGDVGLCVRIIQKARKIDGKDLKVDLPPEIKQKEIAYSFHRPNGERYVCRILNKNYFKLDGAKDAETPLKALAHGRLKH